MGNLCSPCKRIDFNALFEQDIKCFYVGTLADIARRKKCSFCQFVVQVIKSVWAKWKDKVWEPSRAARINVWVKTTLWAHYAETKDSDAHFRYRPSLGTDWEPDDSQRTAYGSPRYTLCEVDRVQDSGSFKYFTDNMDVDVDQVLSRRTIPPMVDRTLLKSWIQECQSNHPNCVIAGETQQALLRATGRFRVIDVETKCLVVPSGDISYTALSYVWGGILHTKTDTERVEWVNSLLESETSTNPTTHRLRVENLPTTIQDAIKLTSLLGWRYIWIDLLCIHQNDIADKEVLVKRMHLIYEEASFTIVAASGQDANAPLAGLFSPRDPESIGEIKVKNDSIFMTPAKPQLPDLLAETVWATRGWTFQEDVLSRCCLYFTSTEVLYSCKEHLKEYPLTREAGNDGFGKYDGFGIGRFNEWRESYVLETRLLKTAYQAASPWNEGWRRYGEGSSCLRSSATVLDRNATAEEVSQSETGVLKKVRAAEDECSFNFTAQRIPETGHHKEYAKFVADYGQRQLSNHDDVVEAIIGILNKFDATPNVEAHGMIGGQLEQDILWVALKETSLRRREGFPSWSWAGWIGPVVYETTTWGRSTRHWEFRPPRAYNKKEQLHMELLFDIHVSTEGSLIATLKRWKLRDGPNPYPSDPLSGHLRSPGILNIYTYVAQVSSLTYKTSSVVRKDATAFNVPILVARIDNDDEEIAVIPDFTITDVPEGEYILAIIGKGERREETDNIDSSGYSYSFMAEYIVLLLKKHGEHFERVGLSVVTAEKEIHKETRSARWRRSFMNKLALKDIGKIRFERKDYIDPPSCWALQWVSLA